MFRNELEFAAHPLGDDVEVAPRFLELGSDFRVHERSDASLTCGVRPAQACIRFRTSHKTRLAGDPDVGLERHTSPRHPIDTQSDNGYLYAHRR